MGAWGPGLFDDDLAADMRNVWDDAVAEGHSLPEASTSVKQMFEGDSADDYDEGPVYWLALASLQLEAGAVEPLVRERALASIEPNTQKWHEESDPESAATREKVLSTLADALAR
jgi:hypothetical protein